MSCLSLVFGRRQPRTCALVLMHGLSTAQVDPQWIIPLVQRFDNKKWEKFNSEKVCHISYARIQGKNALVTHFQNSSLMHEDKRCRPILFHIDGPQAGDQEPFPVGPNVRPLHLLTPCGRLTRVACVLRSWALICRKYRDLSDATPVLCMGDADCWP